MKDRLFSLREANALLPRVRPLALSAVRHYAAAKEAIRRLEDLRELHERGVPANEDEVAALDAAVADEITRLGEIVDELEAHGCHLRHYERGILDFPAASLGPDGITVYCWEPGDPMVAHWRSEHETFDQRRLVRA